MQILTTCHALWEKRKHSRRRRGQGRQNRDALILPAFTCRESALPTRVPKKPHGKPQNCSQGCAKSVSFKKLNAYEK